MALEAMICGVDAKRTLSLLDVPQRNVPNRVSCSGPTTEGDSVCYVGDSMTSCQLRQSQDVEERP